MRIIDARSGVDVVVGQKVTYPDGEWWTLRILEAGIFKAYGLFEGEIDGQRWSKWIKMPIRHTHPGFFLQRVAFVPS
jgi:hypothetical protein